jgi:hypothetical protein
MTNSNNIRGDLSITGSNVTFDTALLTKAVASKTTAELHVYANSVTGNDSNNGLTSGTPKLTLNAVLALVPDIIAHNTVVHLSGTFNEASVTFTRFVENLFGGATNTIYLVIDGGTDLTPFADNGGAGWVSTSGTIADVTVAAAGWAVDAYKGYILEVTAGPCIGQHRMIQGNTADTITPCRNFSVDCDDGGVNHTTFKISRPATTLSGMGFYPRLEGCGNLSIQNLYFTGATSFSPWVSMAGLGSLQLSHKVSNSSSATTLVIAGTKALCSYYRTNVTTFALESAVTFSSAGVSLLDPTNGILNMNGPGHVSVSNCVVNGRISVAKGASCQITGGTWAKRCYFNNVVRYINGTSFGKNFDTASGFATTKISGSATDGIQCYDSTILVGAIDISNNTGNGINCDHSYVSFDSITTGTGNTHAGVYANNNSTVNIVTGALPTLTGTMGNLSVDDIGELCTWVALDAAKSVVIAGEVAAKSVSGIH